jgi:hypothetical protein
VDSISVSESDFSEILSKDDVALIKKNVSVPKLKTMETFLSLKSSYPNNYGFAGQMVRFSVKRISCAQALRIATGVHPILPACSTWVPRTFLLSTVFTVADPGPILNTRWFVRGKKTLGVPCLAEISGSECCECGRLSDNSKSDTAIWYYFWFFGLKVAKCGKSQKW